MAGKKRSFTIYHRDIDPSTANAPVPALQGEVGASADVEQDRTKIGEENRRLRALLRRYGISDLTDPTSSTPSIDVLDLREQVPSCPSAPASVPVVPSVEAQQNRDTVVNGGGAGGDGTGHTIEQDNHSESMQVDSSSVGEDRHLKDNEVNVATPVSKNQGTSSSLPPPLEAAQFESSRPLSTHRHSFVFEESTNQGDVQVTLASWEENKKHSSPVFDLSPEQLGSNPTALNGPNPASAEAAQQPSSQQDRDGVQPHEGERLPFDSPLHELLPESAPSTHAHIIPQLCNNKYHPMTAISAELRGERWLPDMLVTAIRAARGDKVLEKFLDRERYPKFWFYCFTGPGDRRLDYSIYRDGDKVDVAIHKGLPFIYTFRQFIPIFNEYKARISMHYDGPNKPWSFHPCESYWKVGTEFNRPEEGIARGRRGTDPGSGVDSEAAAELGVKRADYLYQYIEKRTFLSGKQKVYYCVWGHHLIFDRSQGCMVGVS